MESNDISSLKELPVDPIILDTCCRLAKADLFEFSDQIINHLTQSLQWFKKDLTKECKQRFVLVDPFIADTAAQMASFEETAFGLTNEIAKISQEMLVYADTTSMLLETVAKSVTLDGNNTWTKTYNQLKLEEDSKTSILQINSNKTYETSLSSTTQYKRQHRIQVTNTAFEQCKLDLDLLLKDELNVRNLEKIKLVLERGGNGLVEHFLNFGGLDKVIQQLGKTNVLGGKKEESDRLIQNIIVAILECICSSELGLKNLIEVNGAMQQMALLLDSTTLKTRSSVLEIFATACVLSAKGIEVILDSFRFYKLVKRELSIFQDLVTSMVVFQDNQEYLTNCLLLINSLLNTPDANLRFELQKQFIDLGLDRILNGVSSNNSNLSEELQIQINVLSRELLDNFNENSETKKNPKVLIELILEKSTRSESIRETVINILQYLYFGLEKLDDDTPSTRLVESNFKELEKLIAQVTTELSSKDIRKTLEAEHQLKNVISEQQQKINDLDLKSRTVKKFLESWAQQMKNKPLDSSLLSLFDTSKDQDMKNLMKSIFETLSKLPKGETNTSNTKSTIYPPPTASTTFPQTIPPPPSLIPTSSIPLPPIPLPSIPLLPNPTSSKLIPPPPSLPIAIPTATSIPPPPVSNNLSSIPLPPPPLSFTGAPVPLPNLSIPSADALPKLSFKNATVATKQFHWQDISKFKVKDSIFMKKDLSAKAATIDLDFEKLQHLFSVETKSSIKATPSMKTVEYVSLISSKRAHNISILLKNLRCDWQELMHNLLNMDREKVTQEMIEILLTIAPTQEEIDQVSQYNGDIQRLGEAERFIFFSLEIKHFSEFIQSVTFKFSYWTDAAKLQADIDCILTACDEIMTNDEFLQLLVYILSVGNFLNSKKGPIYGFKLSSLNKLKDTRAVGNYTLLDFLIESVHNDYDDNDSIFYFQEKFVHVKQAAMIDSTRFTQEIKEFSEKIESVKKLNEQYQLKRSNKYHKFITEMDEFVAKASFELDRIRDSLALMNEELSEISKQFGEDEKQLIKQPSAFFKTLVEFCTLYNDAETKYKEIRLAKEKKKVKEQKASTEDKERSPIVLLHQKMKNGDLFRQRRDSHQMS